MSDLTQILVAASRADRAAEARLQESLNSNYAELAQALAMEIATDGKPVEARQMASLYLKNTLNAKSAANQHELHQRWKLLDPAVRNTVKETLLRALRSPDVGVPHFAAIAASEVACVELPFQEWPNFVGAMTELVSESAGQPESVKIAALECLGMTCERIAEVQDMLDTVPELPEQTVNQMLTTIVHGVQPGHSEALRYAALSALYKSLNFVHRNMEVTAERDFIVRHAICAATQSSDARVRKLAFQCLDLVAELYYDKLQDYMTSIFELTVAAIKNDVDDEVKMAAIEFWCTVAMTEELALANEEDGPKCNKYVESAMAMLVPLLLDTLSTQTDEIDEDSFDLRAVGATCLECFSLTVRSAIVPIVIPFVQQHITSSDNWRMRDAAIVAFSCVLDGPSTAVVGQYVHQSIPVLLGALQDPNAVVRDDATHCIANICKLHVTAIQPEQVHAIIQNIMLKLQETPRLASRACSVIFNISHSLKSPDGKPTQSNLLSAPMLPLMQALLSTMDRPDGGEDNLRVAAMVAAAELITASALDVQPILRDLLPAITGRIEGALKMEVLSNEDRENKAQMVGLLSGLVTALFQRLEKHDVLPYADRVVEIILQVLQVPNANCHEEAFLSMGAIAMALEEDFAKYLQALMPYLVTGLRSFQALQLCVVCVGTVADICGAVGGQIQPFCDQIVAALTECLKDGSAHRDTKPVVFACFGDVAMAIGASFEPYLQVASMLLMQASQAPMQLDDDELMDFINRLRISVMDAYTGIIMGLADGKALHLFVPNVSNVMQFLQFLSTPESYRDEFCLQKAVALVGDIAQQMGSDQRIRLQINQPFVAHLIQQAGSSSNETTRELATWTQGVVREAVSSNA